MQVPLFPDLYLAKRKWKGAKQARRERGRMGDGRREERRKGPREGRKETRGNIFFPVFKNDKRLCQ